MVGDPIANLINSLKTASQVEKDSVVLPYSKLAEAVLQVLQEEKYIESYKVNDSGNIKNLKAVLKYDDSGKSAITDCRRVSKFSKRIYAGVNDIKLVKNGFGSVILTTPQGVMSGKKAKEQKIGGEVLFEIW